MATSGSNAGVGFGGDGAGAGGCTSAVGVDEESWMLGCECKCEATSVVVRGAEGETYRPVRLAFSLVDDAAERAERRLPEREGGDPGDEDSPPVKPFVELALEPRLAADPETSETPEIERAREFGMSIGGERPTRGGESADPLGGSTVAELELGVEEENALTADSFISRSRFSASRRSAT